MLLILAIPVIVAVAFVHRFMQVVAPSNMLARSLRSATHPWPVAVALLGLAAALLASMHVVANAVSAGAPGWLNLVALVLAWDALKVGWLAVGVLLRGIAGGARRSGAARRRSRSRLRRIARVSDDLSLFGDDKPAVPSAQVSAPAPITDWQVDLLRKALDARALMAMEDRQRAIESAAGRKVESLRSLTHDEGLQVLSRLGQQVPVARSETSQWDDREEDTWIDRL